MGFRVNSTKQGDKLTLSLAGRFDLHAHRQFRDAYEAGLAMEDINDILLDMGQVDYMDSSALGMLLLIKEKAGVENKQVVLKNCKETVLHILEVANFQKLFTIE